MAHIFMAVGPYVTMSLVMLLAVFFIPGIATWLPGWIANSIKVEHYQAIFYWYAFWYV